MNWTASSRHLPTCKLLRYLGTYLLSIAPIAPPRGRSLKGKLELSFPTPAGSFGLGEGAGWRSWVIPGADRHSKPEPERVKQTSREDPGSIPGDNTRGVLTARKCRRGLWAGEIFLSFFFLL